MVPGPRGKEIAFFADGTGPSFSHRESDVWRLYQPLDQTDGPGAARGLARCVSRIGTSGNAVARMIDRATGIGVASNLRKLCPVPCGNRRGSWGVQKVRHALAPDDERRSLRQIRFDVSLGPGGRPVPETQEVWFAGFHSDVGGCHPNDETAREPPLRIAGEATRRMIWWRERTTWLMIGLVGIPAVLSRAGRCPGVDSLRGL